MGAVTLQEYKKPPMKATMPKLFRKPRRRWSFVLREAAKNVKVVKAKMLLYFLTFSMGIVYL